MSNERKIAENIRTLIGAIDFDTMLCTVVSVDDDVTCTVKSVKSGVEYKNIKLNANINSKDKGIYVHPPKDSYVLVTMIDKVQGFISMCSDIDKVKITDVKGFECSIEEGKISVKNEQYSLRQAFDDIIDAIGKLTVTTAVGPSGTPINIAEFTMVQQKLNNFLN
jgi:hypothetical protein